MICFLKPYYKPSQLLASLAEVERRAGLTQLLHMVALCFLH